MVLINDYCYFKLKESDKPSKLIIKSFDLFDCIREYESLSYLSRQENGIKKICDKILKYFVKNW